MKILELPRDPLTLSALLAVWESAVRATHDFLTPAQVDALKPQVLQALSDIRLLYGCVGKDETPVAFIGVEDAKIEMLFVDAKARGAGIGKQLARYAIDTLGAALVDVNEQNPQAIGFYQKLGFGRFDRSERDGQGNPFPILHLKLEQEQR